jgi:peptidylprolyl isomerase
MGGTYQLGQAIKAPINGLSHPFLKEILPQLKSGDEWRLVVPAALTVEEITDDSVWQVKLVSHMTAPKLPPGTEEKSTTTKSGLFYERLAAGKGTRPQDDYTCNLEWAFWKEDGAFVGGDILQGTINIQVGEQAAHKFLPEILKLMQVGEVMRVEVPSPMTTPRMIPFKTIWRLKLLGMKPPLPSPEFELPADEALTTTESGLKYKVIEKGDGKGAAPRIGQEVVVHYAGWTTDGKMFDSSYSRSEPATFALGKVIQGWNEGLALMQPGDSHLLVIPGNLAYGPTGTQDGRIPPNATLVFHVKLLEVKSRDQDATRTRTRRDQSR